MNTAIEAVYRDAHSLIEAQQQVLSTVYANGSLPAEVVKAQEARIHDLYWLSERIADLLPDDYFVRGEIA